MHVPTWKNSFLKIVKEQQAGTSPFDGLTELNYVFMRFSTDKGTLIIWDEVNKKKGILHNIVIPRGANTIAPEDNFLPDYELVY